MSLLPRAQATQQVWILPGAAETTGLFGARFSSTLFVTNFGSASASVQIGFIPYSGKPTPAPVTRSIAGGETQQISSVLSSLFGLSSDAGTLTVSSASHARAMDDNGQYRQHGWHLWASHRTPCFRDDSICRQLRQCCLGKPNRRLSNQRSRGSVGSELLRPGDGLRRTGRDNAERQPFPAPLPSVGRRRCPI